MARADEIDDFIAAQNEYVNGDYPRAARDLVALLARGDSAAVRTVRPVARKYLAASYFALRREADAHQVIVDLLEEDPTARLDPVQFEAAFVRLYDNVVQQMRPTLDRILSERSLAQRQTEVERANRQRLITQFLDTEARVQLVPRWQMFVPFGVGQFANGQSSTGAIFLSLESIFIAGSVAAAIVDQTLASPIRPAGQWDPTDTVDSERAALAGTMRVLNWTSLALFTATAIVGIIHANVTYAPTRVLDRGPRPLPPALQGLQISALPGGAGASLTLSF